MKQIKFLKIIICFLTLIGFYSCEKENDNVLFFKNTKAYMLAKAVEEEDLNKIESIVKNDPKLLEITEKTSGSNVLSLSLTIEKFNSFKKLLELGANPNFTNCYSKRSILIDACKFYNNPNPYSIDLRFIKLLLKKGANPNYVVEYDFKDTLQNYHMATSPIYEASAIDLNMVKLLIQSGANPYKKLNQNKSSPFSNSLKGFKNKFEIINYYIDTLKVDVKEPMCIVNRESTNEQVELYIQDYISKFMSYEKKSEGFEEKQKLINKLESVGVDFKSYKYKL